MNRQIHIFFNLHTITSTFLGSEHIQIAQQMSKGTQKIVSKTLVSLVLIYTVCEQIESKHCEILGENDRLPDSKMIKL